MTTETESSHLTQSSSPSSSLPPPQPQNPVDHLSSNDSSTLGLQNAREDNEELSKPQATAESSHVYQSIPCGEQIQKDVASELVFGPQSLSSAFAPRQHDAKQFYLSLSFKTDGEFAALTKNFKQSEIWNGPQGNNNQEDQTVNTIEGSAYMISRKPFDPIGRPFNPFGPIERPIPRLPSSYELADLGFA
ncbi:hypothetical protein Bca101_054525 [Brassica carinata]